MLQCFQKLPQIKKRKKKRASHFPNELDQFNSLSLTLVGLFLLKIQRGTQNPLHISMLSIPSFHWWFWCSWKLLLCSSSNASMEFPMYTSDLLLFLALNPINRPSVLLLSWKNDTVDCFCYTNLCQDLSFQCKR